MRGARGWLRVDVAAVDKCHHAWVALNAWVRCRPVRVDFNAHDAKTPDVTCSAELLIGEAFGRRPTHRDDARRAAAKERARTRGQVNHHRAPHP